MMAEVFKIYIDQLKGGHTRQIEETLDPSFLEVQEEELRFMKPVTVKGEAYLTEDHLVIHLAALAVAEMPCSICNQMTEVPLVVNSFYHTEPLSHIPEAIYDFRLALREALLIELPWTAECNQGHCSSREALAPYLRSENPSDMHFPFADIDKNE